MYLGQLLPLKGQRQTSASIETPTNPTDKPSCQNNTMEKYQLYPLKNRSKMEKQPIKSPTQTLLLTLTSKGSVACLICTIHPRVVPYSEGVSCFSPRTGLSTFKLPTITSKRVFWGVFGRFYIRRGVLKKIHTLHGVFLPAKKF